MQIVLYKNCKFNNAYKNVLSFRRTSNNEILLDKYLNSLNKSNTITLDYSYVTRTGTIPLLLEDTDYIQYGDLYQYNYCKITDQAQGITRYCFITDIDFRDDVALVSYEEDIWHSYGSTMNITESYLSRNRLADKTGFYNKAIKTLPLKYTSNKALVYNFTENTPDTKKYYLVVEFQVYKGTKVGDVAERQTCVGIYGNMGTPTEYTFSLKDAQLIAQELVSCQGAGKCLNIFSEALINPKYFMSISNIYLIPDKINLNIYFDLDLSNNPDDKGFYIHYAEPTWWWLAHTFNGFLYTTFNTSYASFKNKRFSVHTEYISAKEKIQSVGTYSTQIPCFYNGEQIVCNISMCITEDKFTLYLSVCDNFVEITDDFCYEVPFTSVNGEENSLLKLGRILRNVNGVASIVGSSLGVGMGLGSLSEYGSLINNLKFTPSGKLTTSKRKLATIERLERSRISRASSLAQEGIGMVSDITGIAENNAKLYVSTQLNKSGSTGVLNAYYWICYCTTDSTTDFDNYQKECINNTGYTVFEWVKNFEITGIKSSTPLTATIESYGYNFVRFDTINVIGNFPRSVANILEEILLSGTKVWFTTGIE